MQLAIYTQRNNNLSHHLVFIWKYFLFKEKKELPFLPHFQSLNNYTLLNNAPAKLMLFPIYIWAPNQQNYFSWSLFVWSQIPNKDMDALYRLQPSF